jgi:hypothetical protein
MSDSRVSTASRIGFHANFFSSNTKPKKGAVARRIGQMKIVQLIFP